MIMLKIVSSCKFLKLAALIPLLCWSQLLGAAPAPRRNYDQNAIALKEVKDHVDDLRHEVKNHEFELKTYEEKLQNLENIIDSLRQHSNDTAQAHKTALQDSSSTLESKINSLETTAKGLVTDFKQFKNHANETTQTLTQHKQKILELEKILEIQNQNIDNMQVALRSLADVLQIKAGPAPIQTSSNGKTYKVQPGDSLEKIARKTQTNIQALKELNGLTHDRIIVGQTLKLP